MPKEPVSDKENFFQKIVGMLFSGGDSESEKRKLLRNIAKELTKNKFKFYRPGSGEVLPAMAKYFYDIYKTVSTAQALLHNAQGSAVLRTLTIDFSLNDKQKKLSEHLTEESIKERAKTMLAADLSRQVRENMTSFIAEFDSEKMTKIDVLYSQVVAMTAFVNFDYHFLLKKFDSNLPERNFAYTPHFEAIRGEYVADDLSDFIAVAWSLPSSVDWTMAFSVLKLYKDVEPVSASAWNKLLNRLQELKRSQVLEKTIQHALKDPLHKAACNPIVEHIIEPYIEKMKTQTELIIKRIQQENQNSKVNEYLDQLFGTTAVVRLKNYSEQGNIIFEKKMINGFTWHQPLNYLKAFLIDYFKRDIRELSDLVLVRGTWTSATFNNQMSGAYHNLLDISDKITAFDETLVDDGELGVKYRTLLGRMDRDKEAGKILRSQLKDVNEKAMSYIMSGSQSLVVFAKNLRALLEDREKPYPELLINWKELDHFSTRPVKELGVDVYKKIYLFISLMQLFIPPAEPGK